MSGKRRAAEVKISFKIVFCICLNSSFLCDTIGTNFAQSSSHTLFFEILQCSQKIRRQRLFHLTQLPVMLAPQSCWFVLLLASTTVQKLLNAFAAGFHDVLPLRLQILHHIFEWQRCGHGFSTEAEQLSVGRYTTAEAAQLSAPWPGNFWTSVRCIIMLLIMTAASWPFNVTSANRFFTSSMGSNIYKLSLLQPPNKLKILHVVCFMTLLPCSSNQKAARTENHTVHDRHAQVNMAM